MFGIFLLQRVFASDVSLLSREGDPESIVQNISTIHGNYSELEIDLVISAPDPILLSRFYISGDSFENGSFGGWRFNPHCFLTVQKDPKGKSIAIAGGRAERTFVHVGDTTGSILTFCGWKNPMSEERSVFIIDNKIESSSISNTARGNISSWTNLKNNKLYFDPKDGNFEFYLSSGGKRLYSKHSSKDLYLLVHEILPSGNKLFYEYDQEGRVVQIREMNAAEKKELGWIKIQYGDVVHVETSDGKFVDYCFKKESGVSLLSEVIRSHSPNIKYEYYLEEENPFLTRKSYPQGRFVQIAYAKDDEGTCKVRSVSLPFERGEVTETNFVYGEDFTEVFGPDNQKSIYRFDDNLQLTAIETYLYGSLYRTKKKNWGERINAGNLMSISIEDGLENTYYFKSFLYDGKGNIIEDVEFGNLTGGDPHPILFDEEGYPTSHEPHTKRYSYSSKGEEDIVFQKDAKGNGLEYVYKKGTNILLKKFCYEEDSCEKRWFYKYGSNGELLRTIVDDGMERNSKALDYVNERRITKIRSKQDLPNAGAPEIIEEKYFDIRSRKEVLLKKIVNQFDRYGNIILQKIYDAKGEHCYSIENEYDQGLLVSKIDPIGKKTKYLYDENYNLISEIDTVSGLVVEYRYDLRNHLIAKIEKGSQGERFESTYRYDASGNMVSESDSLGNVETSTYDEIGRILSVTYPEMRVGENLFSKPTYRYTHDIFDFVTSIVDPSGEITKKTSTVHGKPVEIRFPDGTRELYKYDPEGSLHRSLSRDGTVMIYEYDFLGRVVHTEQYARSTESSGEYMGSKYCTYNTFHLLTEKDEAECETKYTYDAAGRIVSKLVETSQVVSEVGYPLIGWSKRERRKVTYEYDSLSRVGSEKHWKSEKSCAAHVKKYDGLDRVVEEGIEDETGKVLQKYQYVYARNGQLSQVIGFPQDQKAILSRYSYDDLSRPIEVSDVKNGLTKVVYDDAFKNQLGQRVTSRIYVDTLGHQVNEVFDARNNIVSRVKKGKKGEILSKSEYLYDILGNKIHQNEEVMSKGEKVRTYVTSWEYGPNSQLRSISRGVGSPQETTDRFTYDSYGSVVRVESSNGEASFNYTYNDEGRVDSISYRSANNPGELSYQMLYDDMGSPKEIRQNHSEFQKFRYNKNGQLLGESIRDQWGKYEVRIIYDGEGAVKSIQIPDGSYIHYRYEGSFVKSVQRSSKDGENFYSYQVIARDLMGHPIEEQLIQFAGDQHRVWDQFGNIISIQNDVFIDKVFRDAKFPLRVNKRELEIDGKKVKNSYEYDDWDFLVSEKGKFSHTYSYDSIGNRLSRDGVSYKVNESNQLIETEGVLYTYDLRGNVTSKTMGSKVWTYLWNGLNQLIQVKDPEKNIISYTYDLSGRRLSKKIENKSKKIQIFRYFYLDQTEIGCMDEKGKIVELKVLSNPNHSESSTAIAFEIKKETYVPMYDLQGNVVCLVDGENQSLIESYHYSAFGEEKIINRRGRAVTKSSVGNSWRYKGKRKDNETGLIYFGKRYYDPRIGRWISPDPLGEIDGPNVYAYVHNNPLTYEDHLGYASEPTSGEFKKYFYGEYEPHCYCERHRDCKRGGDIGVAAGAMAHGALDFMLGSLHDFQLGTAYLGSNDLDDLHERNEIIRSVQSSQEARLQQIERGMLNILSVNDPDERYQSIRSNTTLGLEIGSMVVGGYGAVRGIIGLNRFAKRASSISKLPSLMQTRRNEIAATSSINSLLLKNRYISREIASGHAFTKHALKKNQFPGFNRLQFEEHLFKVLNDRKTEVKFLSRDRVGYWNQNSNTIIVRDPRHFDGGTAFKPIRGRTYYDDVLK